MRCPRCESSVLEERERESVTIDVCGSCRGIWLDRGELERLVAKLANEFDSPPQRAPLPSEGLARDDRRYKRPDESWDDDDFKRHNERYGDPRQQPQHAPRKRGFLDTLGELFD
jgi:uncharacterized protein